jgi:ABC-type molybdate transport system substrate-binding protein
MLVERLRDANVRVGTSTPKADRNVYAALMASGQADVFITCCTNAVAAQAEEPTLRRIEVRAAASVPARCGVTVMNGASPDAGLFVAFLLGPAGQPPLAKGGFSAR